MADLARVPFTQVNEQVGEVQVVHIHGHLDAYTAPQLEGTLANLLAEASYRVVLDLQHLDYISSAGLGIMASALGSFREQGGDLKLACTPENVYRVLDLLGFTKLFRLHDNCSEAIVSFAVVSGQEA